MKDVNERKGVTLVDDDDVVATLDTDLAHMKFSDDVSNADIIAYSESRPRYNNKTTLSEALDIAHDINKISNSKDDTAKTDSDVSSDMPKFSKTGLMD